MIHCNTYNDAKVEHNDAIITSTVYAADGSLLFALPGYMVVGWYRRDDLFFKDVTRVTRYPADGDKYWDEEHYNLYHRHKGLLLTNAMHWINDDITWERVVQACDANEKYGLLDLEGNIAFPFIYDSAHSYVRHSWPKPYQLFYIGAKEFIILPHGPVFPSEGAAEAEIQVNEYVRRVDGKEYECCEVAVLEQHADEKWQWSAFQYIDDIIIYEYTTGFVHAPKPEMDLDFGIEYKDGDGWQLWQFPDVPDDITVKLGL